jgi:hypothetical protein
MADIIRLHGTPHEEVQLILPWFVNGTLDPEETALVETHLAECGDCRVDLEAERALSREAAAVSIDTKRNLAALTERLDSRQPRPAVVTLLRKRVSIGWMLAGQFATAAAVLLAIYTPSLTEPPVQTYHTLGAPSDRAAGNVVIVFHPENSESEIRAALLATDARIVDGPNASGAYVLRVPQAQRSAVVDRLRRLPQVVIAEPIEANPGP